LGSSPISTNASIAAQNVMWRSQNSRAMCVYTSRHAGVTSHISGSA
jgi:hypothetical protein